MAGAIKGQGDLPVVVRSPEAVAGGQTFEAELMPQNMRSAVVHITNVDLDSSHKLGWATGVELLSIEPTDLSDQEALGLRLLGYDLLVQPDETQTIAPRFQAQRRGASAGLVFASWKPGDGAPYDQPGIDLAVVGSQP